jgi:hypothetical protein
MRFRAAIKLLEEYWKGPDGKPMLHYDFGSSRFTLFRSPLLISKAKKAISIPAIQVLKDKRFDDATRKQARQIAQHWDIVYLEKQYFAWIEAENITPKDPKPHFYQFIRSHLKRNGERP